MNPWNLAGLHMVSHLLFQLVTRNLRKSLRPGNFVIVENDQNGIYPYSFWEHSFCQICQSKDKLSIIPKTTDEGHCYFTPNVLAWLESKQPFITLWSNLCLGDIRRFNSSYNSIHKWQDNLTGNETGTSTEQFFNMKKVNKSDFGLP